MSTKTVLHWCVANMIITTIKVCRRHAAFNTRRHFKLFTAQISFYLFILGIHFIKKSANSHACPFNFFGPVFEQKI